MESPPSGHFTRRRVLALAAGAAVSRVGRAGAQALQTPRTLRGCVESMETLISPEAIDRIAELSEARQFEYARGVGHLRQTRWGEACGGAVYGALERECFAGGFRPEELNDYIISTIAWRRRGRPLDVAAQLAPFHEARRREEERSAKAEAATRQPGVRILRCHLEFVFFIEPLCFVRGTTAVSPGQEKLKEGLAKTIVGNPHLLHLEVQGHAARGEAGPADLSRERAVAVLQELVRLGAPAERLTVHGLGTRFPFVPSDFPGTPKRDARDADARAEIALLRVGPH